VGEVAVIHSTLVGHSICGAAPTMSAFGGGSTVTEKVRPQLAASPTMFNVLLIGAIAPGVHGCCTTPTRGGLIASTHHPHQHRNHQRAAGYVGRLRGDHDVGAVDAAGQQMCGVQPHGQVGVGLAAAHRPRHKVNPRHGRD
jgi:hypothetical protein